MTHLVERHMAAIYTENKAVNVGKRIAFEINTRETFERK